MIFKEETNDSIQKLAEKYRLKLVMLFGSAARGTETKKSDIDIAVLGDKDFYENNYSDFLFEMAKLERIEKREIEVVPISDRNPILLYHIFKDGIALYKKSEEEYFRTISWARFIYEDNKRFFYGREKLIEKRLKEI